jgi:hypothetical protein
MTFANARKAIPAQQRGDIAKIDSASHILNPTFDVQRHPLAPYVVSSGMII